MSYDLVLYFDCGCTGKVHSFGCIIQQKFRLTAETPPGFWCVRLGSFAIPDIEDIKYKALNGWRMYEFDIIIEPPLKKFERNGRKTYVGLVSMDQDYMVWLDELITEMEVWFGPIRDYQPYLIEVCSRDPSKPKKHPELLQFEEFSIPIGELRLVEYSSGPTDKVDDQFYIDDQQTFKTIWRLKLLNEENDPVVQEQRIIGKMKKQKRSHTHCMMVLTLFVILLGLGAILGFLLYYNREEFFNIDNTDETADTTST